MQWSDAAIVLSTRRHGEHAVIVEALSRHHGRWLGLLHGGISRRLAPVIQPGNSVHAVWRARTAQHLGVWRLEPQIMRAAGIMAAGSAPLQCLAAACALAAALPEQEHHGDVYPGLDALCSQLDGSGPWFATHALWEAVLLRELGFGLDLQTCAAGGDSTDLIYVSPRSGRAVSRAAGAPYARRLFPLPPFLRALGPGPAEWRAQAPVPPGDVLASLRITGHFLKHRVYASWNMDLPASRRRYLDARMKKRESSASPGGL